MNKKTATIFRLLIYSGGLVILAAGIMLSTRATLGVSPIISVAYSISEIFNINFGNAAFIWYALFVAFEVLVHGLQKIPDKTRRIGADLLQLPLSLIFTRIMNGIGTFIPVFETAYANSFLGSIPGRILLVIVAVIFTGVGAAMSLDARLIPNPGDGIVQTLADLTGKTVGTMKNIFDISCVCVTVMISLISGRLIGVGIGTVLAMLGVGRVVAVFNRLCLKSIQEINEKSSI